MTREQEVENLARWLRGALYHGEKVKSWRDMPTAHRSGFLKMARALLDSGALDMPTSFVTPPDGPTINNVVKGYVVMRSEYDRQAAAIAKIKGEGE